MSYVDSTIIIRVVYYIYTWLYLEYMYYDCVLYVLEHIGRFDYEKNEIVVFRKKNKSSKLTSFSGRGVINAPYTAVAEFIKEIDSSFVWDKFLVVR